MGEDAEEETWGDKHRWARHINWWPPTCALIRVGIKPATQVYALDLESNPIPFGGQANALNHPAIPVYNLYNCMGRPAPHQPPGPTDWPSRRDALTEFSQRNFRGGGGTWETARWAYILTRVVRRQQLH